MCAIQMLRSFWRLAGLTQKPSMDATMANGQPSCTGPAASLNIRLPTDSEKRKEIPLASGCLDYFPDALAAVAELSFAGNQKHNPGEPIHWARSKSGDEADALMRHFVERGAIDTDGHRHSAKVAWRALALLQKELEQANNLPISRGSRP